MISGIFTTISTIPTTENEFDHGCLNNHQQANGTLVGKLRIDHSGNVKENRSYFYDFDDRLVRVEKSSGGGAKLAVEYEYDPLGNRSARRQYRLGPDGSRTEEDVIY